MVGVNIVFGVRRYGKSTLCLVFDVCQEDMVNRHCVWCSKVSSVKWDNLQIEAHGCIKIIIIINFVCLGEARWGRSPPPPPPPPPH